MPPTAGEPAPGPVVHLVDGTFELFRCFHGAPRATDPDGREIGAARALLWTLAKLLWTGGQAPPSAPRAIVAVFDAMARPRGAADAALRSQGGLAVEVARALGLPTWVAARGQADDVMASAAQRLRGQARVVLCTADLDLMQCVRGDDVVVWDRIRDRVTDEAGVVERFGVPPGRIPDRSALVGDPSDGLPGVPGWGPKSAAGVLAAHGGLDDIPDDPAAWRFKPRGAERLAASLRALREDARIVRDIATLRDDLVPTLTVAQIVWRGPRPELPALAERLGAAEVLARLPHPTSP